MVISQLWALMLTAAFGADDLAPFVEHEPDKILALAKAQVPRKPQEIVAGLPLDLLYWQQDDWEVGRLAVFEPQNPEFRDGWRVDDIIDDATMTVYYVSWTQSGPRHYQSVLVRGMETKGRVSNKPLDAKRNADWFLIVGTKQYGGQTIYVLDHIDAKPIVARLPAGKSKTTAGAKLSSNRSAAAWSSLRESTRKQAQQLINRFPGTPEAEKAARLLQAVDE